MLKIRFHLIQQLNQLQVALGSQSQSTQLATAVFKESEYALFLVDKKMATHVESLKSADESFKLQRELDQER